VPQSLAPPARCATFADFREGIWDAQLTGQIASQTIEVEEQAVNSLSNDGTDGRVREVKLELRGERAAVVRFITVGDWKHGRMGAERAVQW
jgi:hypothetical protein